MDVKKVLKNLAVKTLFLKDIKCLCCDAELEKSSRYCMCDVCHSHLPNIVDKVCKKCGEPIKSLADFCMKCKNNVDRNFDVARAPFLYKDDIRNLIIQLKFGGKKYLADYLSWFLYDAYILYKFNCDLVIPVPMSSKSLKKRGYNQQELLCSAFVKNGFDVDVNCIAKKVETQTQVGLDYKQRQNNLTNAFTVVNKSKVKNKSILLVDDIYTTGATVSEVSKVLKKAGANSVCVLTLCHELPDGAVN